MTHSMVHGKAGSNVRISDTQYFCAEKRLVQLSDIQSTVVILHDELLFRPGLLLACFQRVIERIGYLR